MGMRLCRPSWFLRLAGGLMTGNITFTGAQTVDGVDISTLAARVGRIKIGQYAGDGAATQNITGVGFQPDCVIITRLTTGVANMQIWILGMDSDFSILISANNYNSDHIKSVNADGFVVGDGTGDINRWNVNAANYCFVCLKESL